MHVSQNAEVGNTRVTILFKKCYFVLRPRQEPGLDVRLLGQRGVNGAECLYARKPITMSGSTIRFRVVHNLWQTFLEDSTDLVLSFFLV